MALNDQRNNGVAKKFDSTYYSRINFLNYKENSRINITYSTGMIKLTYAMSKDTNEGGPKNWEDMISVNITGAKANLLLNAIEKFDKAFEEKTITMNHQSWGIVTGLSEIQTILMFHLNKLGNGRALTISQINASGSVVKKFTYEFPQEQDFYIAWSNFDTMKNEKVYDDKLQYNMLIDTIKEFARTCNGAAGYTTLDLGRYDYNSLKNTVVALAEKSGIQVGNRGNYTRNTSGNGFFNSNNQSSNSTSEHKSLDQIQSEYIDDDED